MGTMISPGDVRTFKQGDGNAIVAGVGMWAEKHGEWIQIHLTGPCRTTVTNNPSSVRFHRTLFRDLRQTLVREECWPFGDDGSEVEQEAESGDRFRPITPRPGSPLASDIIIAERGR